VEHAEAATIRLERSELAVAVLLQKLDALDRTMLAVELNAKPTAELCRRWLGQLERKLRARRAEQFPEGRRQER
jgi:hypothetical protein